MLWKKSGIYLILINCCPSAPLKSVIFLPFLYTTYIIKPFSLLVDFFNEISHSVDPKLSEQKVFTMFKEK